MVNTKVGAELVTEVAKSLVTSRWLSICWFFQRKLKVLVSEKPRRFLTPKFSFICGGNAGVLNFWEVNV